VRHFPFLAEQDLASLFAAPPRQFDRHSPPDVLRFALGATLYSPGTRLTLADDARRAARIGATSQVWCLEDAIAHDEVMTAQANVARQLRELSHQSRSEEVPLLFVRVRTPEQILELTEQAGVGIRQLTGFVVPKIAPDTTGERYLEALVTASQAAGQHLYGMPVLEHDDLAWHETRRAHLEGLRALFDAFRAHVLTVRVGGTDLCGLFGLRRDAGTTIWDIAVVRDALADVVNTFGRRCDYTISGPVWEHFISPDRLLKPQLRQTPFQRSGRLRLRQQLLRDDMDELLREVLLDQANGFTGKTVIHPTHVSIVNTLQAVSREEHDDALTVLSARDRGGVARSGAGNKMNEMGPHGLWAQQVVARAGVYGVLKNEDSIIDLLEHGRRTAERAYAAPSGDLALPIPSAVIAP
jgi:citrate lyase beta subunit